MAKHFWTVMVIHGWVGRHGNGSTIKHAFPPPPFIPTALHSPSQTFWNPSALLPIVLWGTSTQIHTLWRICAWGLLVWVHPGTVQGLFNLMFQHRQPWHHHPHCEGDLLLYHNPSFWWWAHESRWWSSQDTARRVLVIMTKRSQTIST